MLGRIQSRGTQALHQSGAWGNLARLVCGGRQSQVGPWVTDTPVEPAYPSIFSPGPAGYFGGLLAGGTEDRLVLSPPRKGGDSWAAMGSEELLCGHCKAGYEMMHFAPRLSTA